MFFFKSETFTRITWKNKTFSSGKSQHVRRMMEGGSWLTKKKLIVSLAMTLQCWRVDDLHTGQIRLAVMQYNGFYPNHFVCMIYLCWPGVLRVNSFLFFEEGRLNTDRSPIQCRCVNSPGLSTSILRHLFWKVNYRALDFNSKHSCFFNNFFQNMFLLNDWF